MATKPSLTLDSGQVISGLDPNYDAFAKQQKNYIGATNWGNLQKEYTPYQLEKATKNIGGNIFWNPEVNIKDIPAQMASTELGGGSNIPAPEKPSPTEVNALMAGIQTGTEGAKALLEQINKPLPSQVEKDAITKRADKYAEDNKTALTDTRNTVLEQFATPENIKNLQALAPQMAATQAKFDKYSVGLEGKTASASSIYGRQALAQRQKAVEMAGLGAMAQAYQGNITLARTMANDAIDAKYKDIEMYNSNLTNQLNAVYDDLNREDKARADSLNLVIAERERLIAEEKDREQKIASIMVAVAENGADPTVLQAIMNSGTYREAIIKASPFLNIDTASPEPKKIGTDADGNDLFYEPLSGTVKTALQLTNNRLGSQVGTIQGLPAYETRAANPGVNRSDRNNNPGNIKVSGYTKEFDGVIGVEADPAQDGGNFLIFENPEAGINAIGRLLLEGKPYDNKTAEKAIKTYNGGGSYGARDVLLDPNKDFKSQIQDPAKRFEVAMAIAKAEGFTLPKKEISDKAQNWADLIAQGKADITNVPQNERTAVVEALSTTVTKSDTTSDIVAKEKAQDALALKDHKGLDSAVGVVGLGRIAMPWTIGAKQDFIAGVERLVSGLSLESLIEAKSRGATFGALSDTEMRILASSATKIGSWKITDETGKVTGYKIGHQAMKDELDNINKILLRGIKSSIQNGDTDNDPLGLGVTANSTNPLGI